MVDAMGLYERAAMPSTMRCSTGAGMKAGAETRHTTLTLKETGSRSRTGRRLDAWIVILRGDALSGAAGIRTSMCGGFMVGHPKR